MASLTNYAVFDVTTLIFRYTVFPFGQAVCELNNPVPGQTQVECQSQCTDRGVSARICLIKVERNARDQQNYYSPVITAYAYDRPAASSCLSG